MFVTPQKRNTNFNVRCNLFIFTVFTITNKYLSHVEKELFINMTYTFIKALVS